MKNCNTTTQAMLQYACAAALATTFAFALFGDSAEQLTTHFFAPNPAEGSIVRAEWQDSVDTSIVWARLLETSARRRSCHTPPTTSSTS